jgi:hypothetical protein
MTRNFELQVANITFSLTVNKIMPVIVDQYI